MAIKLLKLKLYNMTTLTLQDFMAKYDLKIDTMQKTDFQRLITSKYILEIQKQSCRRN